MSSRAAAPIPPQSGRAQNCSSASDPPRQQHGADSHSPSGEPNVLTRVPGVPLPTADPGFNAGGAPYAGVRLACFLFPIGARRHTHQAFQFFGLVGGSVCCTPSVSIWCVLRIGSGGTYPCEPYAPQNRERCPPHAEFPTRPL